MTPYHPRGQSASLTSAANQVALTFQADFSVLSENAALMAQFQHDVRATVAAAVGVPDSSVTVSSVTSGSVKVTVRVDYPAQGRVASAAIPKLAMLVADPSTSFGAAFRARYFIGGTLSAVDVTPPLRLAASKALPGVAGSASSVSLTDLFVAASNTGALTYAVAATTTPAPASISLDSNAGALTVQGRYRNASYTVTVNAVSSFGVPSTDATVTVTELDAPPPRHTTALGSASPSNATPVAFALSNHFASPADTLPLYFWLSANPRSNASVVTDGVLRIPGAYRNASYPVVVAASNAYGKVSTSNQTLSVTEPDAPAPTQMSALGAASLGNNTVSYGLSNHFATQADTLPLYYYLVENPQSSAAVSGTGVLSVTGNNRGVSYNVRAGASNAYGKQLTLQLAVTEAAAATAATPPVTSGMVGYFTGESWTGLQWTDMSGANNHATVVTGTINTLTYPSTAKAYLYGDTAASIQFPMTILPQTFTAFYVAKYNGTNKKRIIASLGPEVTTGANWLSGFYNGYTGVAYRTNTFITGTANNAVTGNTWLQITDQNQLHRAAKTNWTTRTSAGKTFASPLAINKYIGETSDWAVAMVLVYDRTLSSTEYLQVESWISSIYTGV